MLTADQTISTWKLIDQLALKIIPSSLDRESLVSEVLIGLMRCEAIPGVGYIRRRIIDAFRKETKFDSRRKRSRRREVSVENEVLDRLTESDCVCEFEAQDEVDVLMSLESWSSLESRFICSVYYEGMSVKEAGKFLELDPAESLYVWMKIKSKLRDIGLNRTDLKC